MINKKTKLIAIVGPTASGKTALAIRLAERFNGEIICADSRTIYKGMDIGTAKPSAEERARIPHHLLDLIEPNETLSAAEFKRLAEEAIAGITKCSKVPFLVGGSGLYAYGVIYDYQFPAGPANNLRSELQDIELPALVERLQQQDPEAAESIDLQNRRRVIRALETIGQPRQKAQRLSPNILLLGLNPQKEALDTRVTQRTHAMFQIGLIDEVRRLTEQYGVDIESLKSPGYAEIVQYLAGEIDEAEAKRLIELHTRQLVKRQLTWYRRNPEIQWLDDSDDVESQVAAFLSPINRV